MGELAMYKEYFTGKNIVSVYFGGGTPTLFAPEHLARILDYIQPPSGCEITIEANPTEITQEMLSALKKLGINRLSIGVQSFAEGELKQLGRKHNRAAAKDAVLLSHAIGFKNISIDLMYDVPGQTLESFQESIDCACALPITHLSLYNLTIEPHTGFAKKEATLRTMMPGEAISTIMYTTAIKRLEMQGLKQYEISAFARDGLLSRHNTGYWIGRPFLGFGPSAFSFYDNRRYRNIESLTRYAKIIQAAASPVDFVEEISNEKRQRELLVLHLRLLAGVPLCRFSLEKETEENLAKLTTDGLVMVCGSDENKRLVLTAKGRLFYDYVASELI